MLRSKCVRRPNDSIVLKYRMREYLNPGCRRRQSGICRTGFGSFLPQLSAQRLVGVKPPGRGLITL